MVYVLGKEAHIVMLNAHLPHSPVLQATAPADTVPGSDGVLAGVIEGGEEKEEEEEEEVKGGGQKDRGAATENRTEEEQALGHDAVAVELEPKGAGNGDAKVKE